MIYCYQKDLGFTGYEGTNALCEDFSPSPTDSGICMTRNLNIKSIISADTLEEYKDIFGTMGPFQKRKIDGGTTWGEMSFLIQEYDEPDAQGRKNDGSQLNVLLQLHKNLDLALINAPNNYDINDLPLELRFNKEYTIEVTPVGQQSSNDLKSFELEQRKCKLGTEKSKSSIFNIYTQSICRYECYVELAAKICQCLPWDFISSQTFKECDVFGRTCFFYTMKNVTQNPMNQCPHCLKDCDYIKFEKKVVSVDKLSHLDYHYSNGQMIIESIRSKDFQCGSRNCYGVEKLLQYYFDPNKTMVDPALQHMYTLKKGESYQRERAVKLLQTSIIVHLKFMKPEIDFIDVKYSTMDKLATFGGNFGIFEMISGWSLFGILNLILLTCKCLFRFSN